jgi:hypothetical protein
VATTFPIYYSYATHALGCTRGKGTATWCGDASPNGIKCESGTSCNDARATFCARHGVNGKCFGEGSNPPTKQQTDEFNKSILSNHIDKNKQQRDHMNLMSGEAVHPFDTSKGDPNTGSITVRSSSPAGCKNCNFGDTTCEFLKTGCEAQHSIIKGLGGAIPWEWILLGGGALLAVVLITR